jgi:hypothetical protein
VKRIVHFIKIRYFALACCLLFFASGFVFLPHLGLQNDEVLFASPLFPPKASYVVKIGHSRLPIMIMSYLGTLKTAIYRPIFRLFGTGVIAVRLPMLLAGTASVWLFFVLLRRATGYRAAIIGCGLLAADTLYLLTVCFDWGPVALQHLLLLSGLVLLLGFYQRRQEVRLFWGWFVLGLGIWDKALMVWMLAGLFVAAVTVYRKEILAVITVRRLAISTLAFLLGALPLVVYNVDKKLDTFRSNASYDAHDVPGKARLLRATADGSGLFGWLVSEDWQTELPHAQAGLVQMASAKTSWLARRPRHNLMFYAFVAAVLLAPLVRGAGLRAILFALIAMTVAWAQMAVTVNAGGSVHHAILVWPLPEMVIAISFAAASRRLGRFGLPAAGAVLALVMASALLVTNEYFSLMIRNGGPPNWTDAIYPLGDYMKHSTAKQVYIVDWGLFDNLRLLDRGKLPLLVGSDLVSRAAASDGERKAVDKAIADPESVFIGHTKDWEFFTGSTEKLVNYAAKIGYERAMLATIPDSYGRPVCEVYRFTAMGR